MVTFMYKINIINPTSRKFKLQQLKSEKDKSNRVINDHKHDKYINKNRLKKIKKMYIENVSENLIICNPP